MSLLPHLLNVMQRIDQFVAELIQANNPGDNKADELLEAAKSSIRGLNSISLQSTVVDESDEELAHSEEFRNDNYSYSTVELGMMGTEMEYEIIEIKDTNEVFVGMNDNTLGLGSDNDTYVYGTPEEIEESVGFKPSTDLGEEEILLRLIEGSDVSVADDLAFFENELDAEWLDTAFGAEVESLYTIVVYNRTDENVERRFMTVEDTDGNVEYHFDEYQYDTSVSFVPPNPQSEDVMHVGEIGQFEAASALLGGDGDAGLGGVLGGGGADQLFDQAMSMAEDMSDEIDEDDLGDGLF